MADLTIQGKIIQVLEPQGGTSRAGNAWRKQEYVLETNDNYPKKICFNFFGDRIDQNKLQIGDYITLYFDIESREYNGRWYTDIRGWRAEKMDPAAMPAGQPDPFAQPQQPGFQPAAQPGFQPQQPAPAAQPNPFAQQPQQPGAPAGSPDSLPF